MQQDKRLFWIIATASDGIAAIAVTPPVRLRAPELRTDLTYFVRWDGESTFSESGYRGALERFRECVRLPRALLEEPIQGLGQLNDHVARIMNPPTM